MIVLIQSLKMYVMVKYKKHQKRPSQKLSISQYCYFSQPPNSIFLSIYHSTWCDNVTKWHMLGASIRPRGKTSLYIHKPVLHLWVHSSCDPLEFLAGQLCLFLFNNFILSLFVLSISIVCHFTVKVSILFTFVWPVYPPL